MQIGYHASHEQFAPSELLEFAGAAEGAGFGAAMCSDHLAPFSERQGQSGFAWSWLGAALARSGLSFGTVTAPGQRYHPVIIAQAVATLAEMFPGRFWVALGSGEYLNEHVTGTGWPTDAVRDQRLRECVEIIRRLLRGESVTHRGEVVVEEARLWVHPAAPPPLYAAALSPETAAFAGEWADGLITTYQPGDIVGEIVAAFRDNGGAGKPLLLQAQHCYEETDEAALSEAHDQWRSALLPGPLLADLRHPSELDAVAELMRPEDTAARIRASADLGQHTAWLQEYRALGVDTVYLHNVGRRQHEFITAFGRHVLPALARSSSL